MSLEGSPQRSCQPGPKTTQSPPGGGMQRWAWQMARDGESQGRVPSLWQVRKNFPCPRVQIGVIRAMPVLPG